ncbi:META domain-containing protein [Streptomyces sp. NPDC048565]|uniref:META domain-containing protein n=1 Tax=Streptomyces sp. NPDC048565 TaxID=3155266 RepID=UPI00341BED66
MRTRRMALSVLALLTLAACGSESGSGDSGDGSGAVRAGPAVTGVRWKVSSLTVQGQKSTAPDGAHIEIDAEGKATGSLGCNRFTADAGLDGDKVTIGPGTTTGMGCAKDVQRFENALGKALHGELRAEVAGEGDERTLTLTTARGDSIALASEPAAPLVGTAWKVTALVSGSTATSLPAGTKGKAHLTFGKDGSVAGNLGCNSFHGKAKVSGSTLTFGPLASTKMMCAGPRMELERVLLRVLKGTTTYTVDHRTLSIDAGSGEGLDASAPAADERPGRG